MSIQLIHFSDLLQLDTRTNNKTHTERHASTPMGDEGYEGRSAHGEVDSPGLGLAKRKENKRWVGLVFPFWMMLRLKVAQSELIAAAPWP